MSANTLYGRLRTAKRTYLPSAELRVLLGICLFRQRHGVFPDVDELAEIVFQNPALVERSLRRLRAKRVVRWVAGKWVTGLRWEAMR